MPLQGKAVLVTGVTSGVGKALARSYVERGADVLGIGRRSALGAGLAEQLAGGAGRFASIEVRLWFAASKFWRDADSADVKSLISVPIVINCEIPIDRFD